MPGPPLGPSYRMTTTLPGWIFPARMAAFASSSLSNTRASPVNTWSEGSMAPGLVTPVSGARFPLRTAMPPRGEKGSSRVFITSSFSGKGKTYPETFSSTVRPVQVRASR